MMPRIRLLAALLASASAEPSDCQASGFDPETRGATCSLLLQTSIGGASKFQGGLHEDAHRSQSFSSPECIALAAAAAAYRHDVDGYEDAGLSAAQKLGELGYNFVTEISNWSPSWDPTSRDHDYVGLWAKDGACVVNFKGSEHGEDFLNAANTAPTTKWGLSGVHSGLVAELEPLVNTMDFAMIREKCTGSLTVTGHSLGGGMAQLFALAINNPADPLGAQLKVDFLYTFGPMPVSVSELPNHQEDDDCFAGGIYLTSLQVQDGTFQVDVLLDPKYGGGMLPVPTTKKLLFGPCAAPMVYDCATQLPATVGPIPMIHPNTPWEFRPQWLHMHHVETYSSFMGCSAQAVTCTGTFVDNLGREYPNQVAAAVGTNLFVFCNTASDPLYVKMASVNRQGTFQEARYFGSASCAIVNDECVIEHWASSVPNLPYSVKNVQCSEVAS